MHKNIKKILHLGLILTTLMLCFACSQDDEQHQQRNSSFVEIVGRVPGFTDYDVTTRAAKNQAESEINLMTLMIFDNAGTLINMQHIESSVPLFIIDRYVLSQETANGITAADMYMIANVQAAVIDSWNITTKAQLLEQYALSEPSLDIPANGFPMVGAKEDVNLDPNGTIEGGKIEINLENLYAKVVFNIKLETTQSYFDPTFQLVDWEVHNLPKGVALFEEDTDGPTVFYNNVFDSELTSRRVTGSNPLQGSNTLSFSFYMPEHKVNPGTTSYAYPDGISDNEKQRYKPCLVEDIAGYDGKPVYVVLNGIFTNHQNHRYEVNYKVYLGADNWQNFQIDRNGQYNNSIVIRGITNSSTGTDGISVDHRVNVSYSDFIVQMERETLLDSHFEVRPIRINLNSEGSVRVRVEGNPDWIRLEKKNSGGTNYCDNGKRKYFTTGLMDELSTNPITVNSNDDNCIWVYIDENTETIQGEITDEKIAEQKTKKREAQIVVEFTPEGSSIPTSSKTFTFAQKYLYPVKSVNRPGHIYYIEFYEEYLHNFDSNDDYGLTDDNGMVWGLDGVRLSHLYKAAYVTSTSTDNFFTWIMELLGWSQENFINGIESSSGEDVNYDFYLPRDNPEGGTPREYSGHAYTTEITEHTGISDKVLALNEQPESAIEYCYNKNKRTSAGKVNQIKWYMPSIDEIEDITMSAYTEFDVFQDKYYWSSQPAYLNYELQITGSVRQWVVLGYINVKINGTGTYSSDDLERARATKVEYSGGEYTPAESNTTGFSGKNVGTASGYTNNAKIDYIYTPYTGNQLNVTRGSGNKLRTEKCRIRAVYKHD